MRSVFSVFFCVVLCGVHSAVLYDDQVEIPGFEGKCYDKDAKVFYSEGDIMKVEEGECIQRKCLGYIEETGKLRVETLTCPVVEHGTGCIIIQDPDKPYPECCPKVVSIPSADPKYCEPVKLDRK